ncbi:hypothetical protein [Sandaracinus amylolyticus]|uniref:hypothetical protein n=1 Tax=Sandaracinus amylolyticus TaxID=927083 RepID=UPI001F46E841|nr:hypothetical protein [Sandaracinus amylolyticus]UJR86604.1 Hypothetical protein I5071_87050 [Sandaracinus amylolyticus]
MMGDETKTSGKRPQRGPLLAAAATLGVFVPFLVPIGVLAVAANDRREEEQGKREPEPPFFRRFAIGLSVLALIAQVAALVLVVDVWSSFTRHEQQSGAVGIVGDPCVVADACCEAVHGQGAAPCQELAQRAGQIQDTPNETASAEDRDYCEEAFYAIRSQLVSTERVVPDACEFVQPGAAK